MMDKKTEPTRRQALLAGTGIAGLGIGASIAGGALPALAQSAASATTSLPVDLMNGVFGVEGTVEPGGVVHYDFPRTDIQPVLMGVPLHPDWGFDTEITFEPLGSGAAVKWEMCLLDSEVDPVMGALLGTVFNPPQTTLNATHNHFIELNPKIKFVHGMATGDPVTLAYQLRSVLRHTKQPFVSISPGNTGLPNDEIAAPKSTSANRNIHALPFQGNPESKSVP